MQEAGFVIEEAPQAPPATTGPQPADQKAPTDSTSGTSIAIGISAPAVIVTAVTVNVTNGDGRTLAPTPQPPAIPRPRPQADTATAPVPAASVIPAPEPDDAPTPPPPPAPDAASGGNSGGTQSAVYVVVGALVSVVILAVFGVVVSAVVRYHVRSTQRSMTSRAGRSPVAHPTDTEEASGAGAKQPGSLDHVSDFLPLPPPGRLGGFKSDSAVDADATKARFHKDIPLHPPLTQIESLPVGQIIELPNEYKGSSGTGLTTTVQRSVSGSGRDRLPSSASRDVVSSGAGERPGTLSGKSATEDLHDVLDLMHYGSEEFWGEYRVLSGFERRGGGQGVVQFMRHMWNEDLVAVKFFLSHDAYDAEMALYAVDGLRGMMPRVIKYADDGHVKTAAGYAFPACMVMEKGESLKEWREHARPEFLTVVDVRLFASHMLHRNGASHVTGVNRNHSSRSQRLWSSDTSDAIHVRWISTTDAHMRADDCFSKASQRVHLALRLATSRHMSSRSAHAYFM